MEVAPQNHELDGEETYSNLADRSRKGYLCWPEAATTASSFLRTMRIHAIPEYSLVSNLFKQLGAQSIKENEKGKNDGKENFSAGKWHDERTTVVFI